MSDSLSFSTKREPKSSPFEKFQLLFGQVEVVKLFQDMAPELLLEELTRSPPDYTAPFHQMPTNPSTSLASIV